MADVGTRTMLPNRRDGAGVPGSAASGSAATSATPRGASPSFSETGSQDATIHEGSAPVTSSQSAASLGSEYSHTSSAAVAAQATGARSSWLRLSMRGLRPTSPAVSVATLTNGPPPSGSAPWPPLSPVGANGAPGVGQGLGSGPHYGSQGSLVGSAAAYGSSSRASPVVETRELVKAVDDESGFKMINNYVILSELGRGVHGKVKLARKMESGELVAVKIIRKAPRTRRLGMSNLGMSPSPGGDSPSALDNPQMEKIRREIAIMKKCVHANVVQLFEVIDDPSSEKVYIVLEYLARGEIKWKANPGNQSGSLEELRLAQSMLTEAECRSIFRDIIVGLEYLHTQGIIHRDIKPANLLRGADGRVKLSDFGVSYFSRSQFKYEQRQLADRRSSSITLGPLSPFNKAKWKQPKATAKALDANDNEELAKTAGSPAFFAPELCILGDDADEQRMPVTKAIDVWACGVTLYCLCFGRCPFVAATEFELFDIIPNQPLSFPQDAEVGNLLQDLLERLLDKNPSTRMKLSDAKQHAWTVADLPDAQGWLRETDPIQYEPVRVTQDEVNNAFTSIMERLRRQFRRLSNSFHSMSLLRKRRTISMPSVAGDEGPARAKSASPRDRKLQSHFHLGPMSKSRASRSATSNSPPLSPQSDMSPTSRHRRSLHGEPNSLLIVPTNESPGHSADHIGGRTARSASPRLGFASFMGRRAASGTGIHDGERSESPTGKRLGHVHYGPDHGERGDSGEESSENISDQEFDDGSSSGETERRKEGNKFRRHSGPVGGAPGLNIKTSTNRGRGSLGGRRGSADGSPGGGTYSMGEIDDAEMGDEEDEVMATNEAEEEEERRRRRTWESEYSDFSSSESEEGSGLGRDGGVTFQLGGRSPGSSSQRSSIAGGGQGQSGLGSGGNSQSASTTPSRAGSFSKSGSRVAIAGLGFGTSSSASRINVVSNKYRPSSAESGAGSSSRPALFASEDTFDQSDGDGQFAETPRESDEDEMVVANNADLAGAEPSRSIIHHALSQIRPSSSRMAVLREADSVSDEDSRNSSSVPPEPTIDAESPLSAQPST